MDDLDRLFHKLVAVMTQQDPAALRTPFQVSEIYRSILPYRVYKRHLEFDTNEDYEMAVLRLLAGERGYASIEPAEAQEVLKQEATSINPNPGAFRQYAAATVRLSQNAAQTVLRSPESYAPPAVEAPRNELNVEPAAQVETPVFEALHNPPGELCPHCNEAIPSEREVKFCPFCGGRIGSIPCQSCGTEIELGWRYCVTCGHSSPDG